MVISSIFFRLTNALYIWYLAWQAFKCLNFKRIITTTIEATMEWHKYLRCGWHLWRLSWLQRRYANGYLYSSRSSVKNANASWPIAGGQKVFVLNFKGQQVSVSIIFIWRARDYNVTQEFSLLLCKCKIEIIRSDVGLHNNNNNIKRRAFVEMEIKTIERRIAQ